MTHSASTEIVVTYHIISHHITLAQTTALAVVIFMHNSHERILMICHKKKRTEHFCPLYLFLIAFVAKVNTGGFVHRLLEL